ncbi:hypothetical protein HDV05_005914 [Chytridiales sp. JEL 0842]|nr:hypothetical protein HDV05_005914 [Chytridiales sp. JEL 0842]
MPAIILAISAAALALITSACYSYIRYLKQRIAASHVYHKPLSYFFLRSFFKSPVLPNLITGAPTKKPTVGQVMDQDSRSVGLSDYGPNVDDLIGNLEAQLTDVFDSGKLTKFYALNHYNRIVKGTLEKRLLVVDYLKKHPTASKLEIPQPIFIMGSWRSGTTALHAYFDLDPDCRAFTTWELRQGILPPKVASKMTPQDFGKSGADPRIAAQQFEIDFQNRLFPDFVSIHNLHISEPDECDQSFLDLNRSIMSYVAAHLFPATSKRLIEQADRESAYRWYKRYLQAFEHQRLTIQNGGVGPTSLPYKYTVFKLPSHSMNMSAILRVFPGAKFVWPHRDFRKVLPSFGNLCYMVHYMMSEQERTRVQEGRAKYELLSREVPKWMRERERLFGKGMEFEGRMADLYYVEFVKSPVEAMRKVYGDLEIEFPVGLAEAILARKRNDDEIRKSGKAKPHSYTAEEFGLTEEMMEVGFGEYERAYNVPRETKRVV